MVSLLQKIFQKSREKLDKRLHRLVIEAAETLSRHKELSIFGIGRAFKRKAKVKHNIKTIDRLFGNKKLALKGKNFYKECATWLIGNNKRPIIIIDWSGLTRCGSIHFLRACVPVGGRALPILDKAFRLKDYMKQASHKLFLKELALILPLDSKPIIVTDAGFRCPWFKLVALLGWDFVGRVRNVTQFKPENSERWEKVKCLYEASRTQAMFLFKGLLAKSNSESGYFYILKNRQKHRIKKNLAGKKIQCSVSKKHAKREKEPWLLFSSLSPEDYTPCQIMVLYKKRMQIEESIRDLKNTRNGFSLRHCRSYHAERLNIALLIAAIAMLLLWLLGLVAKNRKLHLSYQANSIKSRAVLSNFIIGWQVVMRDSNQFSKKEILRELKNFASKGDIINAV